jgi:methylthioribulose-1-phosphate dehydratase
MSLAILQASGADAVDAVIDAGRFSAARGWVPATSGNFSARGQDGRIAITASGVDKGALTAADVLEIALDAPRLAVPIFPNSQDIAALADDIDRRLDAGIEAPGYLLAGHGLYAWGATMRDALRHAEAFEFLFGCELAGDAA